MELDAAELLREGVGGVQGGRHLCHLDFTVFNPLLDGEMANVDVSRSLGWLSTVGHKDSADVVLEYDRWFNLGETKIHENRADVQGEFCHIGARDEFRFRRGCCHSSLIYCFVCHDATTEESSEACNRSTVLFIGALITVTGTE